MPQIEEMRTMNLETLENKTTVIQLKPIKFIIQVMKDQHEESHTAKIHETLMKHNATSCKKISQKLPLNSLLTQQNPAQMFTPYIPEINFNIILKILHAFIILCVQHATAISTCILGKD